MFRTQAKADQMHRVRKEIGLKNSQVIAIADGANDLRMMAEDGIKKCQAQMKRQERNTT